MKQYYIYILEEDEEISAELIDHLSNNNNIWIEAVNNLQSTNHSEVKLEHDITTILKQVGIPAQILLANTVRQPQELKKQFVMQLKTVGIKVTKEKLIPLLGPPQILLKENQQILNLLL